MGQLIIDVETDNGMELWPVVEITDLFLTSEGLLKVKCGDDVGTIETEAYEALCDERSDLVEAMLANLPKKPNALTKWMERLKADEKRETRSGWQILLEEFNKE
jgi:hypothetical protein